MLSSREAGDFLLLVYALLPPKGGSCHHESVTIPISPAEQAHGREWGGNVCSTEAYTGGMEHCSLTTIGHSTHSIGEFIALLQAHAIQLLVDVRTIPRSRAHPQFGIDLLPGELQAAEIDYRHLEELGGRAMPGKILPILAGAIPRFGAMPTLWQLRPFRQAWPNWRNLLARNTVIMCAEALPWRCHRSLIADALTVAGWHVWHIMSLKTTREHTLTPFLRVEDGKLLYLAEE